MNGACLGIFSLIFFFGASPLYSKDSPKDIEIIELERTPAYSVHRVRIWTQEKPHIHAAHDSKVLVQQGGGVLYMAGREYILGPGHTIEIPRNVPHFFVHRAASSPFTQARVTFTPPFDGKDRILLSDLEKKPASWRTKMARWLEKFFSVVSFSGSTS